jgi:formate hydrogenlyase subunit 6/NADH:ubiquinone oxidoreductase subunit I
MADTYFLPQASLDTLFAALAGDGRRILAPTDRDGRTELCPVQRAGELARDHLQTTLSAKAVVFPKVERILSYRIDGAQVELQDAEPRPQPTVLFGLRPCEASAFRALDAVFNWDTRDRFFNARMAATSVVGMACTARDEACFCTSVGGSPGATAGSDILLTPVAGGYLAEVLSEPGRALRALAPQAFQPDPGLAKQVVEVPVAFDQPALTASLKDRFEDPIWAEQSLRCIGCGACAYVCPTCVCFDLVEQADAKGGERLRTWDSCGAAGFTQHASGHNPRPAQAQRWRQRVYHKFSYYPERYRMLGCVGCGKCTRACPVDMNLQEHLAAAAQGRG